MLGACVKAVARRMNLAYCIVFIMEVAFVACVYEILFVGWAVERHCTVEGGGVAIEMHVVERMQSGTQDDRLHVSMNATFRVDKEVFTWRSHPVKLRRIRDLLVGHYDTERARPIAIDITWDMGGGAGHHHVLRNTMEGSAYQICYDLRTLTGGGGYTFDHPGDPDDSLLSLAIVIGLVNVVAFVWWCAARGRT